MRCAKCGTDNREGRKFCASCGTSLAIACPKCGTSNLAGEQFCGECGAPLSAIETSAPKSVTRPEASVNGGERRHLTILFCDLVGSVALTSQLDPEEWRATVADYQRAASEAITRFGGEVVRYVGDGIMAFFGYPVAHDNDAERAARAGLAILDAVAQLNPRHASIKLSLRIGIDSGPVVVGVGAGQAVDAFGDAANIAARVQSMAEPDTVLVTGETQRLIAGLFEVEDRSTHQLKGVERATRLYRVVRPSGIRGRFEAAAAGGTLTRFVGREDDLHSLLSRWARVRDGEGQVVTISGEAGIGKSRLVRRFHEEIAASPHLWLQAGAGVFFQSTPFYPITELIRQLTDGSLAADPIAQLESSLGGIGLNPAEAIPLLAPLLNLPSSLEYPPSAMSPEQQRRRLLATLVEWLLRAARDRPLVTVIEDLHWIDPSTLELIQLLVEQGATARLLLLYTARPEFRPPWPQRAHHLQLTLDRLSSNDVRTIVDAVAADRALADGTITTLVERTGGVPLFVEELTRAVLESGDAESGVHAIPATLHDSLMARLDRLGDAKEVLQVGAVLGSEFSYELLRAVHQMNDQKLQEGLRSLTDAELLYVRGLPPDSNYQFKHALIREAAYEALLKSRRKELHRIVASTIDEKFSILKDTHPEVLARHWSEADDGVRAIPYLNLAGEQATVRASHSEAIAHFREALDWLDRLPPQTDETTRCSVLYALGREQRRAGQNLQSRETMLRAAELARLTKSTELLLNVGLDLTRLAITVGLPVTPAPMLFEEALCMLGSEDSPLKARALSGLAKALATAADQQATSYGEKAVAMSRRLGSVRLLLDSLNGMAYALSIRLEDAERRLACTNEMLALLDAAKVGTENLQAKNDSFYWEALARLDTFYFKALGCLDFGNIPGMSTTLEGWSRRGEELQEPFVFALTNMLRATLGLMQGRFEDGERFAREALTMGQRLQTENAAGIFGQQMFALYREQGRLKELEPAVRFFVQQNQAAATWRPGLALIYSELGRRDDAQAEFEHLAKNDFADFPRDGMWMGCMSYLSEVCIFLGDRERAAILYELLLPFDGRALVIGFGTACCGALSRYLGALAATMERWDDAIQHFEDALVMNARMEAWTWLAHTQFQYAKMLLVRGRSSDRERAFALLDAALATTRRLGMRALEERASALLDREGEAARL